MDADLILSMLALALGLSPILVAVFRRQLGALNILAVVLVLLSLGAVGLGATLIRTKPAREPLPLVLPREVPEDGYVGSDVCRSCHPYQHASWHASYHRTMTQVASEDAILAPFDGTELELEGKTWRVEKRADEFWVTRKPTGFVGPVTIEKRVVMATGSHNYQLYWLDSEAKRGLEQFPLVYLLYDQMWIPRKSRFIRPPVEKTPTETGRWRAHCIKCHSTRGRKEPVPGESPSVAELGISCESCHGPGAEHAEINRMPQRRYRYYLDDEPDPTIVNPARLAHDRSSEVCGQCHSIEIFLSGDKAEDWIRQGTRYRPGAELSKYQTTVIGRYEDNPPEVKAYLDNHRFFRLRNCFWPDGKIRVGGREYHGMLESPCFKRGEMSCLSCHNMHRGKDDPRSLKSWATDQLERDRDGDGACLGCHEKFEDPKTRLAHTHHEEGSTGSSCYNCHMSYTTWGLLRAIRSHTVESPDVKTTVATGRPNACNQCHLDRTLKWSAEKLKQWYDIAPPELTSDQETVAASVLWTLTGDAVQRGLMGWSMGWEPAREASGEKWLVPYLSVLLLDPYDAVRFNAQRSLRTYPEYRQVAAARVSGTTRAEHKRIMQQVLSLWKQSFPGSKGKRGAHLLITPDGVVEEDRFKGFARSREDPDLVLFE